MFGKESVIENLKSIREKSPLVQNITNYVVMNNTANALLAIGASPIMAHSTKEVEDMVKIVNSLVINIGTLSPVWIEAMLKAGKAANEKGIPIVLDPVGVGATPYRTETALQIIKECNPSVIRGNSSEIMALVNADAKTKGVDSLNSSEDAIESAKSLAGDYNCVVTISGKTDYITDGNEVLQVNNGTSLLTKVTGMGCTATALTGAFVAIYENNLIAAANTMAVMGIAGEIAEEQSSGPGTMQLHFLDALYNLNEEEINKRFK